MKVRANLPHLHHRQRKTLSTLRETKGKGEMRLLSFLEISRQTQTFRIYNRHLSSCSLPKADGKTGMLGVGAVSAASRGRKQAQIHVQEQMLCDGGHSLGVGQDTAWGGAG